MCPCSRPRINANQTAGVAPYGVRTPGAVPGGDSARGRVLNGGIHEGLAAGRTACYRSTFKAAAPVVVVALAIAARACTWAPCARRRRAPWSRHSFHTCSRQCRSAIVNTSKTAQTFGPGFRVNRSREGGNTHGFLFPPRVLRVGFPAWSPKSVRVRVDSRKHFIPMRALRQALLGLIAREGCGAGGGRQEDARKGSRGKGQRQFVELPSIPVRLLLHFTCARVGAGGARTSA